MARKRGKRSIISIGEELGLSPATVSRVINNRTGVSEEKRRLVLQKLREYDFKVNYPSQRKPRIAIVSASSWFTHYHTEVLGGIFRSMQDHDLTPCTIIYESGGKETLLSLLRDQQCSGVILIIPANFKRELPELSASGLPVMLVDESTEIENVGFIDNDSYSGSLSAVRHLLSLGHREIAYFYTGNPTLNHEQRILAYEAALKEAGLACPPRIHGDRDPAKNLPLVKRYLQEHPEVTAVMTTNDDLALLVLKAAEELGIRVPDELSVVGFDDYPMSAYLSPSLTTVFHPSREAGIRAAESIAGYLESNGKIALKREVLPTELRIRASTGRVKNIRKIF